MTKLKKWCAVAVTAALCAALFCVTDAAAEPSRIGGALVGESESEEFRLLNMMLTVTDKNGSRVKVEDLIDDVMALRSIRLSDGRSVEINEDTFWDLLKIDPSTVVSVTDDHGVVTDLSQYTITVNTAAVSIVENMEAAQDSVNGESRNSDGGTTAYRQNEVSETPDERPNDEENRATSPKKTDDRSRIEHKNGASSTENGALKTTKPGDALATSSAKNSGKTLSAAALKSASVSSAQTNESASKKAGIPVWVWIGLAACAVAAGAVIWWRKKR